MNGLKFIREFNGSVCDSAKSAFLFLGISDSYVIYVILAVAKSETHSCGGRFFVIQVFKVVVNCRPTF